MSQYSFPLLSEREISVSLGELGMTVGPDHFAKPTYELVQPVYENLVAVLMGLSRCGGVFGEGCVRDHARCCCDVCALCCHNINVYSVPYSYSNSPGRSFSSRCLPP